MEIGQASYYDGKSAKRISVTLGLSNDRLSLEISAVEFDRPLSWRLSEIRGAGNRPTDTNLQLYFGQHDARDRDKTPARLVIKDPKVIAYFERTRPSLFKRDITSSDKRSFMKRTVIAVAAVALMILVILPGLAGVFAQFLPVEKETALGRGALKNLERVYGKVTEKDAVYCSTPDGDAALQKLTAHVVGNTKMDYDLDIRVLNDDMINAFTLPGGIIILMDGLLQSSASPEGVTGVLAHELGHVVERHTVKNVLYTSSMAGILSMIFGDMSGGAALAIFGEQLIGSSYSRNAENEADSFAIASLTNAEVDLNGFAEFFDLISENEPSVLDKLSYLSSHPISAGRATKVRDAATFQKTIKAPLNQEEWYALQHICD